MPACATVQSFAFQLREAPKATSRLPRALFLLSKRVPVYPTAGARREGDRSEPRRLRFAFIADVVIKPGGALSRRRIQNTSPGVPCSPACRWQSRLSAVEEWRPTPKALQGLPHRERLEFAAEFDLAFRDPPLAPGPAHLSGSARGDWRRGRGGAPGGGLRGPGLGRDKSLEAPPFQLSVSAEAVSEAETAGVQLGLPECALVGLSV
eukprot:bmy_18710T0